MSLRICTLRFGEVAAAAATVTFEQEPATRDPKDWTFVGKRYEGKLVDRQIVNGSAMYAASTYACPG